MDEYERFEGTKVDYYDSEEVLHKGKIVNFDREIGLTVVGHDDPDKYILCMRGPSSTFWEERWSIEKYYAEMDYILKCVKDSKPICNNELNQICYSFGGLRGNFPISSETCAFNQ